MNLTLPLLYQKITGWCISIICVILVLSFMTDSSAVWVSELGISKILFFITLLIVLFGAVIFTLDDTIKRKYALFVGVTYAAIMIMYGLLTVYHWQGELVDFVRIFLSFASMILTFYFLVQDSEPDPHEQSMKRE